MPVTLLLAAGIHASEVPATASSGTGGMQPLGRLGVKKQHLQCPTPRTPRVTSIPAPPHTRVWCRQGRTRRSLRRGFSISARRSVAAPTALAQAMQRARRRRSPLRGRLPGPAGRRWWTSRCADPLVLQSRAPPLWHLHLSCVRQLLGSPTSHLTIAAARRSRSLYSASARPHRARVPVPSYSCHLRVQVRNRTTCLWQRLWQRQCLSLALTLLPSPPTARR